MKQNAYLKEYAETEGIELNREKITVNPSHRNLAKLCANSLWGKLCQRALNRNKSVINSPHEFYQMLISPAITVHDICCIDTAIWASWSHVNTEDQYSFNKTCIPIGAFTTTHARLKLFHELIQMENEILYCDTDSLIYIEHENLQYSPKIGSAVGQLTDEIAKYGTHAYISEFVCIAPKSYSLRITNYTVCW